MKTTEWKWKTKDGLEMYSKAWQPDGKSRGVVCIIHGVGEHIGRYHFDGEALSEAGYTVAGFDQRGFGQSQGQRGHTPSLEAYFDDIDKFLAEVAHRYPGQTRFLYGHSMGGILVLAYTPVRKPEVAGVIATGPGLKTSLEKQKVKVVMAKVLGKLLPTLSLKSGVPADLISRDLDEVEKYKHDPLVHPIVSTSWGKEMLRAIGIVYDNAPHFPLPLLLMHGGNDEVAYPSSSTTFAELAPKDKVTLMIWDGFKHELHTDPEKAGVFKVMVDWLNQH